MLSLEELEQIVVSQTLNDFTVVEETMHKVLDAYINGFGLLGKLRATVTTEQERVWSLLIINTFKSLRWAYYLALRGYYEQAFTLTRSALENWLVCMDCDNNPETVLAYLDKSKQFPTIRTMANRLPEELRNEWKGLGQQTGLYGFLNSFSHPNLISGFLNMDFESGQFGAEPQYSKPHFVKASYMILGALRKNSEFLARLLDGAGASPKPLLATILEEIHERQTELETSI